MSGKNSGNWIKVHRRINEWGWRSDPNTFSLFLFILSQANWHESEFLGYKVERGQAVVTYPKIKAVCGLSAQCARTALKHLKSTGEITVKVTSKFSIVTVLNYDTYQMINSDDNSQTNSQTNSQLTVNQQSTNTIQEYKKKKKNINIHISPENVRKPYPYEDSNVLLSDKEVSKLIARMGEQELDYWLSQLEGWANSNKAKFSKVESHYLTICNWRRREQRQQELNGTRT